MPYPNSNILNIVIPQTSASKDGTQAPFVERIISGSNLILQTDSTGTLIGSSDLNLSSITASNITASGYISASNLYVKTNITDAGTLNVLGITTLASLTASTALFSGMVSASAGLTSSASNIGTLTVVGATTLAGLTGTTATFSGLVSASAGLTASAIQDAGTLTVVGNSILSNVFATNITASNISASGNISASTLRVETSIVDGGSLTVVGNSTLSNVFATNITASNISASGFVSASAIFDTGTLTVVGNSTLSNVFATNITASNISASGNISASRLRVETSIVDGGSLTVLGNTVLGDAGTDTVQITGSTTLTGSLNVVGNSTLQNTFVTNLTSSGVLSASRIVASEITASSELFVGTGPAYRTYGEASVPENLARLYVSGSATIFSKYATLNLATSASDAGAQSSILFSRLASSGSEAVLSPRMQLGTESGSTDLRVYAYYSSTDPDIVNQAAGANIVAGTRAIFKQSGYFGVGSFISYGAVGGATTTYVSSLPGYSGIVGPDAMLTILPMDSASLGTAGSKQYNRNILNIMSYDTSSIMFISGSDGYVLLGKNTTDGINRLQVMGNVSASAYTGSSANFTSLIATNLTASNISASGTISASTLIVTGTTTLANIVITNLTSSNITASGNISSSTLYVVNNATINGDLTVNGGDIVLSNTATNISLLDNVGGALDIKEGSNSYIKIDTTNTAENVTFGTTPTVYILKTTDNDLLTYNNGALQVDGGVGINKNLYVGSNTYTVGNSSITGSLTVGTTLRVNGNSILGDSLSDVNTSSGSLRVLSTTQATDWTTGALTVAGGVGVGKNLYVSGSTFLYGDLTIYGTSSIVNISSSTVIVGDNRVVLNALTPYQRYAGIDVYDSGSANATASLLWDGQTDNWITVDQNNSASNMIIGPTASFGSALPSLTVNRLTKAYEGSGITDSLVSDDGTTLRYTGNVISASSITSSYGTVTYITGALVTYVTGSFNILQVSTGSSPGTGQVPSLPTNSGFVGQITVDNNFIYVYTGNIWKRVPISNWTA
jgi:hypothetical protein